MKPNRAMFLSYERSLQPDLVGAGIIVPIAGLVGSRDPGPLASDQHTETAFAQEADVQRHGPLDLCRAVSIGAHNPKRSGGFEARYRYKVAPRRVQIVLALEVTTSWWPTKLIDRDTQAYREMSIANPLWGAPRIHGELLKLGIGVGETSVAKYMVKRREPPSQGWKTFLHNHADGIAAMDLFVVPTTSFRLFYGLLIMGHGRRQILWFGVTAHPTAE